MNAVILAAGRGSRMKDLTDDRPKCLLELHGRSLLDSQTVALREAGITDIAIVTGYRRDLLVGRGFTEFHNPRWAETNMVSSLACAAEWLESGPCVVSYSDIFYGASAVAALMTCPGRLAVTYDPHWRKLWESRFGDPLVDAESFRMRADGTLAEIGNRPGTVDEVEGQYMGLLRFTPDGWHEVQRIRAELTADERDRMHMTGTLQRVIEAGRIPVHAISYAGKWGEVDSKQDLEHYAGG
jgi:choline kinase